MPIDLSKLRSEPLYIHLKNEVPDSHQYEIGFVKGQKPNAYFTLDDVFVDDKPIVAGTNAYYLAKVFLMLRTSEGICLMGVLDSPLEEKVRSGPDYSKKVFWADVSGVRYERP